jgi:hypothetical protein
VSGIFTKVEGIGGAALFSPDGRHRYRLDRDLVNDPDGNGGRLLWVMLNPSVAGAHEDDPTVRKCVGFARRMNFERLSVVNLYSLVSTDPADLADASDRITRQTDTVTVLAAAEADQIVVAWGSPPKGLDPTLHFFRVHRVLRLLRGKNVVCLGRTKEGWPRHPSRLAYDTDLEVFDDH